MKFNCSGFVLAGVLAIGLIGCPAPSEKDDDVTGVDSGVGGSGGGSGGSGGNKDASAGQVDAPAASGGGGGGSAGSTAGSGGGGTSGSAGRDAAAAGSGGGGSSGSVGRDASAAGSTGGQDAGARDASGAADTSGASELTFAKDIYPLFKEKCSSCHPHYNAETSVRGEDNLKAMTACDMVTEKRRVIPNNSAGSYLYKKLLAKSGTNNYCGDRMPRNGSLDMAQLDRVKAWIDQGAKW